MSDVQTIHLPQTGWQHNSVVGQAIIRLLFGTLFTIYAYVAYRNGIFGAPPASLFNVGIVFVILASTYLLNVGFVQSDNWIFKSCGMSLDILFATFTMILGGSSMVFLYGIFLWIIIGNGLRFGRNYMYLANVMSLTGFSIVLVYGEFWQQYPYIGAGLMFWMILMPIYIGKLLSKLEHAVELADKANRAKSRFLANMSHEIRTPLTAIIGFSETALDEDLTQQQRTESLHTIKKSGEHLLNLVNDILDFSKIDAGELDIEKIRMEPLSLVAEVESLIHTQAEKKSLSLSVDYHFPLPLTIISDPVRLKQILINLCSNAIKFTERGSIKITVDYLPDEQVMSFMIRDTGIGMKEEELSKVFKPFKQADSSTTRKFGGTGLGLSLSRQLADLLGGQLTVDSVYNEGTTFILHIPCNNEDLELINGVIDIDDDVDVRKNSTNSLLSGKVLLAEDNEVNQQLIIAYLEKMGVQVMVANDGKEACEIALENDFDLIYMDMQMPVMSGVDATIKLREQNYNVPIVALTANATNQDRQLCKASGFNEFMTKPIVRDIIYETTARYLKVASNSTESEFTEVNKQSTG